MFYRLKDIIEVEPIRKEVSIGSVYDLGLGDDCRWIFSHKYEQRYSDVSSSFEYHFHHINMVSGFKLAIVKIDGFSNRPKKRTIVVYSPMILKDLKDLSKFGTGLINEYHFTDDDRFINANGSLQYLTRKKINLDLDAKCIEVDDILTRAGDTYGQDWKVVEIDNKDGIITITRHGKTRKLFASNKIELKAYNLYWYN